MEGNHLDFFEKKHLAQKRGKKANNEICKYQLNGIKIFFFTSY